MTSDLGDSTEAHGEAVQRPLPPPIGYRYWSRGGKGGSSRWVYAKPGAQPPGAEPLYTAEQMIAYRSAALDVTAAHTDHPLRHWDRTCPACQREAMHTCNGLK